MVSRRDLGAVDSVRQPAVSGRERYAARTVAGRECGHRETLRPAAKDALHVVGGRDGGTTGLAQGSALSFGAAVEAREHEVALLYVPPVARTDALNQ